MYINMATSFKLLAIYQTQFQCPYQCPKYQSLSQSSYIILNIILPEQTVLTATPSV